VSYAFIAAHAEVYTVSRMCEVLQVSTSGYYEWRTRQPSQREQANNQLLKAIRQAHDASRQTYGSPRIRAALQREGIVAGKHRIARLMRENGLAGKVPKRKRPRTTQHTPGAQVAPNLLAQTFTARRPNQIWLADITYIDTREGWLYLAAVLDLYARPVVGWAMDTHLEATLVERSLLMALGRRLPDPGLIHHSDRGSQFTSHLIQSLLARHNIQVSMSGVGNCYDNAPMESFFGTLKTECATAPFATQTEARRTIFEYLEVWYNRQRLHSAIGYLPPAEFEQQYFYPLKTVR
jgi:putative transposase